MAAHRVYELTLAPLGPFSIKPPQPFEAGVHGPGSVGSSLSYPMPSTIAGRLAGVAYRRTPDCADSTGDSRPGEPGNPYADQERCLQQLLGEGFRFYTGLLLSGGGIYGYVNTDTFPSISDLGSQARLVVENWRTGKYKEFCGYTSVVRAVRSRRIGIALDSKSKSVEHEMLYSLELVSYKPPASILSIILARNHLDLHSFPTKLGTKTGVALLNATPAKLAQPGEAPKGEYAAVLISPALLQSSPFQDGIVWLAPSKKGLREAEELAGMLLREAQVEGTGITLYVPKGEHELAVQNMGWSISKNRPRPPMLVVPPGTVLEVSLREPIPEERALKLGPDAYLIGLGCCSRLGWGTTLLFSMSSTVS